MYGSLSRADVQKGQQVIKGQVIGAVGVSDPELDAAPALRDPPQGSRDRPARLAARRAEVTVHRCSTCGRFRDYREGDRYCSRVRQRVAWSRLRVRPRIRLRAGRGGRFPLPALRRATEGPVDGFEA